MIRTRHSILTAGLVAGSIGTAFAADDVVVNAIRIDAPTLQLLERLYGVPIRPGRYWYDTVSGAWGLEGGPTAGLVHPQLALGGPLRADASKGNTGIFVNGRELHRLDEMALRRCGATSPGRYWVMHTGVGGREGGPPLFNLAALCAAATGGGAQCQNYGGGQFNCGPSATRTGSGSVIGEGGKDMGVYVPGGGLVLTPN